jgi:hypothetical protein
MRKINFDNDYMEIFYLIPFISNFAIISIISGESKWGPYREGLNSIQVRLIGFFALIFCIYIIYNVLIKLPKTIGGTKKIYEVLKIFFTSKFFIFWVVSLIISFSYEIYKIFIIKIIYYIIIIICLYFQFKFIRKIKSLLC